LFLCYCARGQGELVSHLCKAGFISLCPAVRKVDGSTCLAQFNSSDDLLCHLARLGFRGEDMVR
jgi:hypothetical protein